MSCDSPLTYNIAMFRPSRIILAIVIGLFITLACVVLRSLRYYRPIPDNAMVERTPTSFHLDLWRQYAPASYRDIMPDVMTHNYAGGRYFLIEATPENDNSTLPPVNGGIPSLSGNFDEFWITGDQYGWPLRWCYISYWHEVSGSNITHGEDYWEIGIYRFPARIMPLPMIANIILLSVGVWLLLILASWARVALRLRAGKCPICGYRLRDRMSNGCPECGWNRPVNSEAESEPVR